ncbi:NADPH-dependent ferric siderophore reductase [Pseudonocardia eucalypti]|nr:NADPH-dependent ferric siderophore reductase [Pseudonocardia eucalypti]
MTRRGNSNGTAYPYFLTRVVRTRRITPNLVRITVGGDGLAEYPYSAPDQWMKLFFPLPGQDEPIVPEVEGDDVAAWYRRFQAMPDDIRPNMRTFTVRAHRPGDDELDIEFVLHGDQEGHGPASRWASHARPGDPLGMLAGPSAFAPPADAPWLLLAGDHSALPAIASSVESLAPGTRALAYVELDDPADQQSLPASPDVLVHWVYRDAGSERGQALVEELRRTDLPAGTPYVWLAGEAGMVRTLRRHLTGDRGIDKKAVTFVGYWRRGKTELDAYTEQELADARS